MTTMVPTAVATWAALGEGGSPSGVSLTKFVFFIIRTNNYTKTNINLPRNAHGINKA
jgi:hypothetical protein